jgi:hypothetical protein
MWTAAGRRSGHYPMVILSMRWPSTDGKKSDLRQMGLDPLAKSQTAITAKSAFDQNSVGTQAKPKWETQCKRNLR